MHLPDPPSDTPPPGEDDRTRVAPLAPRGKRAPPENDATVIKRPARHAPRAADSSHSGGTSTSDWGALGDQPSPVDVGVGTLLKGRFLLEKEIGRGGMGVVYLARDERKVEAHDRDPHVAVKVLNDGFRHHPDALVALQREARKAQRLAHDNIVRVYDFDKDGAIVFMTMEFVAGRDLRSLIRARMGEGMPMAQAYGLIEGMGHALRRAHEAGLVHSDFKPGNVMVEDDRVAKVFDFGIARATRGGQGTDDHTVFDATSLGAMTPAYASLEMLRGEEPAFADDVYAFGCVVYELLAGRHPFDKQTAEQASAAGRTPAPVPGLGRRQNRALRSSLAFDGRQRPDMATLLERLRPRSRRERVGAWLAAALLAAVVGMAGATWLQSHRQQAENQRVLAGFSTQSDRRFADEVQANIALQALNDDDRHRLIIDHSGVIESFLLSLLDGYWSPASGRDDYAGAQRVMALREQLKLFSPQLEARGRNLGQERDRLLNDLDTQLDRTIAQDVPFERLHREAVAILERIRRLDPQSGLLRNAKLALRYDAEVGRAIEEGNVQAARRWLSTARQWFPDEASWNVRDHELDRATMSRAPMPTRAVGDAAMTDAEIASHIESVQGAAAAHDVGKVRDLLARITELQADHPFPETEGRQLLAAAMLGHARALFQQGRWDDATAALSPGSGVPDDARLHRAAARYALVQELAGLGAEEAGAARTRRLRSELQQAMTQDRRGFLQMRSDLSAVGRRGAGVIARLDALAGALDERAAEADAPAARERTRDACAALTPGSAAMCVDSLGRLGAGPALVVIPREGSAPLAVMRSKVKFGDLARFCVDTGACPDAQWQSEASASDIPHDLLMQYAAWLGRASGYAYRLPSDAEWLTAAHAGGGRCAFSETNRWGLVGMRDGFAEWVRDGDRLAERGGRRQNPCGARGKQDSSGEADPAVGARLVREIE